MKPFSLTYDTPTAHGDWMRTFVRRYAALRTARAAAARLAHRLAIQTTAGTYWRDVHRAPVITVWDERTFPRTALETLAPEVHAVPSVGDTGVTP